MADLPRYTSFASLDEASEWARDVMDYLQAMPRLEEHTARVVGGGAFALSLTRTTPPSAVLVMRAESVSSPGTLATVTAAPAYTWRQAPGETRGEVYVTDVDGLTSNVSYDLRLLVVG